MTKYLDNINKICRTKLPTGAANPKYPCHSSSSIEINGMVTYNQETNHWQKSPGGTGFQPVHSREKLPEESDRPLPDPVLNLKNNYEKNPITN
jgi:triacylglycerol esterase/lipase EstA (alpha/beta hydrolase family)